MRNISTICMLMCIGCSESYVPADDVGGAPPILNESGGQNSGGTGGTILNTGGSDSFTGGTNSFTGGNASTGGLSSSGGESGTSETGGSGGGVCVPKTCETVTLELTGVSTEQGSTNSACGSFDNGCGMQITCECSNDRDCGFNTPVNGQFNTQQEQENNLCGGGCIELTWSGNVNDKCFNDNERLFMCPGHYIEDGSTNVFIEFSALSNCTDAGGDGTWAYACCY